MHRGRNGCLVKPVTDNPKRNRATLHIPAVHSVASNKSFQFITRRELQTTLGLDLLGTNLIVPLGVPPRILQPPRWHHTGCYGIPHYLSEDFAHKEAGFQLTLRYQTLPGEDGCQIQRTCFVPIHTALKNYGYDQCLTSVD